MKRPSYADECRFRLERDTAMCGWPLDERISFLVSMDILIAKPRFGYDADMDAMIGVTHRSYVWSVGEACLRSDANLAREVTACKLLRSIVRDGGDDALDTAMCSRIEELAA